MPKTDVDMYELERLRKEAANYTSAKHWIKVACAVLAGAVLFLIATIFVWKLVNPKLNLYKANTEKQSVIREQEAISEAAEYAAKSRVTQATAEGEAKVIEAKALAEAQRIIAETLTPEYVQYLYVEAIRDNPNQIIYVPTEAGLPILEAGRSATTAP